MSEAVAHRTKRPHAKGVLCDTSFRVAHKGRGKSLSVWVKLDKAKRPHVKEVHIMLVCLGSDLSVAV